MMHVQQAVGLTTEEICSILSVLFQNDSLLLEWCKMKTCIVSQHGDKGTALHGLVRTALTQVDDAMPKSCNCIDCCAKASNLSGRKGQ